MPETLAPVQPQIARRCPACGRVSADSERCLRCWRDIAAVTPLTAEEAATAMKVEAALARRMTQARFSTGQKLLYGFLGILALLIGWWVYATFIDKPPKPDRPAAATRSVATGAWTTSEGDARGLRSIDAPSRVGGTEAWKVSLGSPVATPLVSDGRLVVAALEDGRVVGLDAASGKTLWTVPLSTAPFAAPVIAGDRVYIAQREGRVTVLTALDGKEAWQSRFVAGSFQASPVVVDGVVYTYSTDGLFAFDAETGRILWEQILDVGWATVAPVVEGQYLVVATGDKSIAFDRTNGRVTFHVAFSRTQPSSLSVRDGRVLAVYGRNATVFETSSRSPWWDGVRGAWFRFHLIGMAPAVPPAPTVWDVTSLPRTTMAAAVGQKVTVVTSRDGVAAALSLSDGKPVWSASTGRLAVAPIATADGFLFGEEGRLLLLDASTGQPRGERKIDGIRSLALTRDLTVVATSAGEVLALR